MSETAAVIDLDSPLTKQGLYNLDPTRKGFGYGVNGAMTRYVRVPARCLHHLPDSLPFEKAGLTEPCCVAYNAVAVNANVKPGDRIVVLGPGPDRSAVRGDCPAAGCRSGRGRAGTRSGAAGESASNSAASSIVDGLDDWARAG